jgi:hypothetical protein
MTKTLTSAVFAVQLLLVLPPTSACSLVACLGRGIELQRDFVVLVKHEGKPLQGVTIRVTDTAATVRFSGVTASNGMVRAASLPPGDYWLSADLLGVNAAYHCFHVAERASRRAKRRMIYEWGDFAPATSRIAGTLIDSQPGTGDTPLWNLVHRVNVPVREARLKLQNPLTGAVFSTVSDQNGAFAIDRVPPGVYVLHIEGGKSGRDYDATDLLINLSPRATKDKLVLTRREAGGGSCGGTSLELSNAS